MKTMARISKTVISFAFYYVLIWLLLQLFFTILPPLFTIIFFEKLKSI